MMNYTLIKNGEFAYNKSYSKDYPLGAIKMLRDFEFGALSTLYIVFKSTNINSDFLESYYQTNKWHREIMKIATEGARNHGLLNISANDFFKTNLYIPKLANEQIQISEFVVVLDNLITLYQRKNELFSKVITGYNQLVLSNNKTRPILRFNSYNEDWKNFQVKDLFKVTRGQVLATHLTKEEPDCEYCYPVYSSQTKNNGLLGYYNKYLFDSAITWTTDGANAGTVNFRSGKFYSTNVNGVLLSEKGYANSAVAEALNSIAWKYVSRVGNPKLMNNVMQDISITIPPTIEEQMRISFSIEKLNEIFIKNSSNIQHLQKLKEIYLQKLFI